MPSRTLLIAIAIAAISGSASTQTTRTAISDPLLDQLVARALANAPELASARSQTEAARLRIEPIATLPDPTASLTWDGDRRMVGVMATQALPWPGKLAVNRRAAEAQAAVVDASLSGRAALTIESRLRNAWYDLALARALAKLVDEGVLVTTDIVEVARQRYAAGLTVQQDVLRAQAEVVRLKESTLNLQAAIAAREAELTQLIGSAPVPQLAAAELPSETGFPSDAEMVAAAIARNPELETARRSIDAARVSVEAAKLNLRPDFVISAGPMFSSMNTAFQAAAGISLPIHSSRRQKNQIAEATATVDARTDDVAALRRDVEIRTHERIASLHASVQSAALYRNELLPLDQLSYESALTSYQAGKLPFIGVLEALRTLYTDRASYASRLAESAKWRVAIDESALSPSSQTITTTAPGATSSSVRSAAMGM